MSLRDHVEKIENAVRALEALGLRIDYIRDARGSYWRVSIPGVASAEGATPSIAGFALNGELLRMAVRASAPVHYHNGQPCHMPHPSDIRAPELEPLRDAAADDPDYHG